MANYVKISCLSAAPYAIDPALDLQEAVDRMIAHWRQQLEWVLPEKPDLIVLPEYCDRPAKSSYPTERRVAYYRQRQDQIRDFFAGVAKEHQCYITYSAHLEMTDGSWRNATQLLDRNGEVAGVYCKNHLVIEERTLHNTYYGKDAPIFQTDFGRVAFAICFDLNFDELRLKYVKEQPDLIIFNSAYHGGLMQNYWAYSCRAHFAGSVYPPGPNTIISPVGELIGASTNYYQFVTKTVNLDCAVIHIDYNETHFSRMKQKYGTKIRIHDPGYLGSVLLSSETDEFSVDDIIEEFGLERLDDYFRRALAHRCAPGNMEA